MFNKKRKLKELKYKFLYGKSPSLTKRDFSTSRYTSKKLTKINHPFFNKIKKFTIIFIFLLITIFSINGIFFSNYFKIAEIKVADDLLENTALADQIKSSINEIIGENLIFLKTDEIKIKILDFFPEIEDVTIEKDYPNKISINFVEYPLVANIINESPTIKKTYIVNSIGYAIKEDLESPTLPYITIQTDEPLNPKNPIIEANKLRYILETKIYFEDKFDMKITKVIYKKTAREIHLLTERDFYIWLDIQVPSDKQLKKLKKALVKLDIYKENLEYIDLRIAGENGDKIIYKRKS